MATKTSGQIPSFQDIEQAMEVVGRIAHRTPVLASRQLSEMAGAKVLLKAENLQRTGSFKIRGAANKVASLTDKERQQGIIAASAGNHAQGVALAAREMGIGCTVVMPVSASLAKIGATKGYGAEVIMHGDSFDQAMAYCQELAKTRKLIFIHAFDDPEVIAGQGTIGIEICQEVPEPGTVLVPVGGGGLIAGIALAVKILSPKSRIIGVQADAAPAAYRSFTRGRPLHVTAKPTLADGIAVGKPGGLPWKVIHRYVDGIVTVSEEAIAHAQVLLLERAKLLVEGAGAVGLAALLEGSAKATGQEAVVVLSGGNVDMNLVSRILEHGLAHAGRYQTMVVMMPDRPGQLGRLLMVLADEGVNVLEVNHERYMADLPLGQVLVEITGETRDASHAREVAGALERAGYTFEGGRFVAR